MSAALHTDPRVDATAAAIEAVNLSQNLVSQARSVAAERGSNKQQVEALVSLLEEAARVQERWGRVDDEWRMRLAGIVHHTPKTWQAFTARSFHELAIEMLECVRGWIVSVVVGIPSFRQLPGNAVDLAVRSLASCHSQVIEWADAIQIDTMAHRAAIEEERAGAVRDFAGTASDAEHRLGFNPNHALALLGVVARLQDEKPLPDDPHDTTDHYIPCSYKIMKWMEAKHGCSTSEYANLERELVGLGYLIREPAYNATLLEITRSGRRVLASGVAYFETQQEVASATQNKKTGPRLKHPSKKAIAAYRAHTILGRPQLEVADELKTSQGQVSRWCGLVAEFIESGGILPTLEQPASPVEVTMDPSLIEMGPRHDHRKQSRLMGRKQADDSES